MKKCFSNLVGGSAISSVASTNINPTYNWKKDGESLENNSPSLTLKNVQARDTGSNSVGVTGNYCTPQYTSISTLVLPGADSGGVTDQFDLEPNTPSGASVDPCGISRESDGDGIPDYRDKELLTPQNWFSVDVDGIGNCAQLRVVTSNTAMLTVVLKVPPGIPP